MNRTYITVVVVALLCAAGIAYSQGWFNWSSSSREIENSTAGTEQSIERETTNDGAMRVTQETAQPADTVTE